MPTTAINGTTLAWREAGTGERALLLLHAFPLDSRMWRAQLEAAPAGWRLIAPDARGFGESAAAPRMLDMATAADDAAALLAHLGLTSAVVCGLSMGGYMAFAMLRRHPGLLRGLVFCDTRADKDSDDARMARLDKAAAVREGGTAALVDGMLPTMLAPFTMSRKPQVVEEVRGLMTAQSPDAVSAALLGMADRPDSTPLLRSINVPTLVLSGSDDAIIPAGEGRMMARAIPGARFDTIEDAGHLPNMEMPADFNRYLHSFLAAIP